MEIINILQSSYCTFVVKSVHGIQVNECQQIVSTHCFFNSSLNHYLQLLTTLTRMYSFLLATGTIN